MKKRLRKFSSLAIIALLLLSGCLDSQEAIGSNLNPVAVVDVVSGQGLWG